MSKMIVINSPAGLIEVPAEGNRLNQARQRAGYGLGFTIGALSFAIRKGLEAAGSTQEGLGFNHGYESAQFKGENMVNKYKMSRIGPDQAREIGKVSGFDVEGLEDEQVITLVATKLTTFADQARTKEGKASRFPLLHKPPQVQKATRVSEDRVSILDPNSPSPVPNY